MTRQIQIQRFIDWLFFIPFCGPVIATMWLVKRYRIENIRELRRQYKEWTRDRTPLLICSNHLTYIDSCLIIWAFGWHFWYFTHFRALSWNLPAVEYKEKLVFRLIGYFSKCVFIDRKGGKDHQNEILDAARALLEKGEVVTIFPEGKRSRTGIFEPDKLTYGVGKILAKMEKCRVLCIYVRSEGQTTFSKYPPNGARVTLETKLITPTFTGEGREAYSQIVTQIGGTIKGLEEKYFRTHRAEMAVAFTLVPQEL